MQEFILRANIDHFRKMLQQESDASKRWTISQLLAEYEAKLTKAERLGEAKLARRPQRQSAALHDAKAPTR